MMYEEILGLEEDLAGWLPSSARLPAIAMLNAAARWSEAVWQSAWILPELSLRDDELANGRRLIQNPVFVCGVHRSGTTLMRDLLDGHPELCVLPSEGSFFTNLLPKLQQMPECGRAQFLCTEWLRRLANPINQPPYWLLGRSTAIYSPYVAYARAFKAWYQVARNEWGSFAMWPHFAVILAYATVTNKLSARFWVDKTPAQELFLEHIWHQFPSAKIIQMLRAPEDVFISRKKMEPWLNIRRCLQEMDRTYRLATQNSFKNKHRYLVLRYEDLCKSPEITMTEISSFLGIEDHPTLLVPTVAGQPASANSSFKSGLSAGAIIKEKRSEECLEVEERLVLAAFVYNSAGQAGYCIPRIHFVKKHAAKLRCLLQSYSQ